MTSVRVGRRLIYGLIDPRSNSLFYVGKTHKRREIRLAEHIERAVEGRQTPVSVRIRDILRSGYRPVIFVLRRLSPNTDWRQAEKDEIRRWRMIATDQLPKLHPPQTPKSVPITISVVALVNVQVGG